MGLPWKPRVAGDPNNQYPVFVRSDMLPALVSAYVTAVTIQNAEDMDVVQAKEMPFLSTSPPSKMQKAVQLDQNPLPDK